MSDDDWCRFFKQAFVKVGRKLLVQDGLESRLDLAGRVGLPLPPDL